MSRAVNNELIETPPASRHCDDNHTVQFYDTNEFLAGTVADFICAGVHSFEPVIVVTTAQHRHLLGDALRARCFDEASALRSGRLEIHDAEEMLARLLVDGKPSWERFLDHIGSRVRAVRARNDERPLRAFGKMVDLLWSRDHRAEAIALEKMWSALAKIEDIRVMCAYANAHFRRSSEGAELERICDAHRTISSNERFARLPDEHARLRELVRLEQRARSLEAEIEHRERTEEMLREQSRINTNLVRIASVLSSELDLDTLLEKLTNEATSLCRARFGVFFRNLERGESEREPAAERAFASTSQEDGARTFPTPRDAAIFRAHFDGGRVVRIDDAESTDDAAGAFDGGASLDAAARLRSYLAIPVRAPSGEVLGGLFFGHPEPNIFREEDVELLGTVGTQASIAIDNAKLFQTARLAEGAAQEEREKLRQLFMQSPALIVIMRGPHHVCDFVNSTASRLFQGDDVLGKTIDDAFPELSTELRVLLDEIFASGRRYVEDAVSTVRDWNGNGRCHERVFNMVYEPYRGSSGRVEGIMAFGFDVTEQVLAQRRIEAVAEELETANRMKDEFLAAVSHELRTPLNAILGWVRMLRSDALPPEKCARALEVIERNAHVQTQLVEDLLDVSRIVSGKLRLEATTVELPAVLDNAIEAVRPAAAAKNVRLEQTLDSNAGPILGDANRLHQIVWNLLMNGVKFTPRGGSVHVELRKQDSSVEIIVADSGEGIAREFLPHVFERFRQADATTTRKYGGLGLGLAIVRSLVEQHGGTIAVESDGVGRGAAFTVRLPISPLRSASFERPPTPRRVSSTELRPGAELEGVHILVIDDEPDARELLAEMLSSSSGATVSTTSSVADALRIVQEERPQVVVSDIGMPGEDGYDLIRKLRALPVTLGGKTPAVALTAYARVEDRTKALVAGFNMHVPKPVEPAELIAVLSSLVTMFSPSSLASSC